MKRLKIPSKYKPRIGYSKQWLELNKRLKDEYYLYWTNYNSIYLYKRGEHGPLMRFSDHRNAFKGKQGQVYKKNLYKNTKIYLKERGYLKERKR